jgi:signal transduction histidine kinase
MLTALLVLAGIGALCGFHFLRMRQVRRRARERLTACLAERDRMGREVHDSLLQSWQGLVLRFQAVSDRIPSEHPARELLERSLERADRLLLESREAGRDLWAAAHASAELGQLIIAASQHLSMIYPVRFRLVVEGSPRTMNPTVSEEFFLIGREALSNAFRHAQAREIAAEICYREDSLRLRICDDGRGIDPQVLAAGTEQGCGGFRGMRERAARIHAHLGVLSEAGSGTELELCLEAEWAYRKEE